MIGRTIAPETAAVAPKKSRPRGKSVRGDDLLPRIDRVLSARQMPASRFGRRAVNDPGLINRLREGGGLRPATLIKVEEYLRRLEWLASIKGVG